MKYEYHVQTQGLAWGDDIEAIGKKLHNLLNGEEPVAFEELGWELWRVNTLFGIEAGDNKGFLLIYRRPLA